MFLYSIKLYDDHLILISLERFLDVLISFVAESVCTLFLKFFFMFVIVNSDS